jgi:hypothetical protein
MSTFRLIMIKTNYVYMAAIVNILITDTIIKMYNRPIAKILKNSPQINYPVISFFSMKVAKT